VRLIAATDRRDDLCNSWGDRQQQRLHRIFSVYVYTYNRCRDHATHGGSKRPDHFQSFETLVSEVTEKRYVYIKILQFFVLFLNLELCHIQKLLKTVFVLPLPAYDKLVQSIWSKVFKYWFSIKYLTYYLNTFKIWSSLCEYFFKYFMSVLKSAVW